MMKLRYSVIIPIYNAEATLPHCLDSLAGQVRSDTEILLINDGSTDGSGEICKSYTERFPQFHYHYQENAGVSKARNVGLDAAKGEYILFVDSDDYVSPDYFSEIDRMTADKGVDLAMFWVHHFGMRNFVSSVRSGNWSDDEAFAVLCSWMRQQVLNSLCSKVFKREILQQNKLRFDETLSICEDLSFIFSFSLHVRRLICDETVLYHVREENKNSLSRKHIEGLPDKLLRADAIMRYALAQADLDKKQKKLFQEALARNYYRSAYSSAKQWKNEPDGRKRRKEIAAICMQFSRNQISPENVENMVISLPIRFKLSWLIDLMIRLH